MSNPPSPPDHPNCKLPLTDFSSFPSFLFSNLPMSPYPLLICFPSSSLCCSLLGLFLPLHLLALLSRRVASRPPSPHLPPPFPDASEFNFSLPELLYWFRRNTRLARAITGARTVCIRLKKYLRKILRQMESINSKSNTRWEEEEVCLQLQRA